MAFRKLHPALKEIISLLKIETPTPFQQIGIKKIKSGANVYGIAPNNSGKTTSLIISVLQKLQCAPEGNAPRAVVVVENKEKAVELHGKFLQFTKYMGLRVYMGYEKLHIDIQKSEIFMGIDILITTPKNIYQLFLANGVSLSQLKFFAINDADFLIQRGDLMAINSLTESIKKCQYVVFAEKMNPKLDRLQDYFMTNPTKVIV